MDKILILKEEIANDPLTRDYTNMTDEELVTSLNTKNRDFKLPIGSAEMLAWAANGRYMKIKTAADSWDIAGLDSGVQAALTAAGVTNDLIRSICWGTIQLLSRDGTSLDLNKTDRAAMLATLVSCGVLSNSDKDALDALADVTESRAVELGIVSKGAEVLLGHVKQARSLIGG